MTCRDMDDVISSHAGDSVLGPQSAAHLARCERCRTLTHSLDEFAVCDQPNPSERQLRRIQTESPRVSNRFGLCRYPASFFSRARLFSYLWRLLGPCCSE